MRLLNNVELEIGAAVSHHPIPSYPNRLEMYNRQQLARNARATSVPNVINNNNNNKLGTKKKQHTVNYMCVCVLELWARRVWSIIL